MLIIDGAAGEGGGQILRTALALAMCVGEPVRMVNIRARRARPGLRRQHLTAVQAAVALSRGQVAGAEIGSQEILFTPGPVAPGEYRFAIGTAGSTTLVFQTLLPVLLTAAAPSRLILEGGTHNPLAPPFEFLQQAFLPLINRLGPRVEVRLERCGFYPAGGGRWLADIQPCERLQPLQLADRGAVLARKAIAICADLPEHIPRRELQTVAERLSWSDEELEARILSPGSGPGNCLHLVIQSQYVTEVFTGFGERGVRAETVAERTVQRLQRYLAADVPVAEHLADQLLLPMALAGGGEFVTLPPSPHALTNMAVIRQFLAVNFTVEALTPARWRVRVSQAPTACGTQPERN